MPTLTIDAGDAGTHSVTVDDSFLNLSPGEQEAAVNEITASVRAKHGPKDTSFSGALGYGTRNVLQGLGATAQVAGEQTGGDTVAGTAQAMRQRLGTSPNYDPATPKVAENLNQGNWGEALSYLPRAGVEMLPDVAGAAMALRAGGIPGLIAFSAARTGGTNAEERAKANNHARPTGSDVVASLPATAWDTAANTVGMAAPGAGKLANPLVRGGYKAVAEGVSNAAQEAGHEVLAGVGTDQGVHMDPGQIGAAGLAGTAARGAHLAAGATMGAASNGVRRVADTVPDVGSVENAQSIARINASLPDVIAGSQALTGKAPTPVEALNSLRKNIDDGLGRLITQMVDQGVITRVDADTILRPAHEQARRHNSALFTSETGKSAWDRLQALELPPQIKEPLANALVDLNNLSTNARMNRQTGPFERGLGVLGHVAGAGAGMMTGGVAAIPAAVIGHSVAAAAGKKLGKGIDNWMGLGEPTVVRQGDKAQKVIDAAGVEPGPHPLAALDHLQNEVTNPTDLAAVLGMRKDDGRAQFYPDPNAPGGGVMMTPREKAQAETEKEKAGSWMERELIRQAKAAKARREQRRAQQERADERARTTQERAADQVSGMAYKNDPQALDNRAAGVVGQQALQTNRRADYGEGTAGPGYDAYGNPVPVRTPGGAVVNATALSAMRRKSSEKGTTFAPEPVAPTAPGSSVTPTGYKAYIQQAVRTQTGDRVTPGDIHKAIDWLVQTDVLPADVGEKMKAHNGPLPKDAIDPILAQVMIDKGRGEFLTGTAGASERPVSPVDGPSGPSTREPIRDPQRWQAAREDRQRHAERLAQVAEARGDTALANVVRKIGATASAEEKQKLRDAFVNKMARDKVDPEARAKARALLKDPTLMKGV